MKCARKGKKNKQNRGLQSAVNLTDELLNGILRYLHNYDQEYFMSLFKDIYFSYAVILLLTICLELNL